MIQVMGPDGRAHHVYRPWTDQDMKDNLSHLPTIEASGDKFSDDLLIFCQQFSPTFPELRRRTFLADSGATHSVIKATKLPGCKLSGRFVYFVGAAGVTVKEMFTRPVKCTDKGDAACPISKSVKHSFLLSEACPINLLGRDLLLALGLNLISTPDGLIVTRSRSTLTMVQNVPAPLLHVYQWLVSSETTTKLFEAIKGKMSPQARLMSAPNLHCTAHVTAERDDPYVEKFFALPPFPSPPTTVLHHCLFYTTCFSVQGPEGPVEGPRSVH